MNNSEILGEEAAVRQIVEDDFSATNGHFEDSSIMSIRNDAFRSATNLQSVSFPNVTTIGTSAFFECYKLKEVLCPKLRACNNNMFYKTSIKELVLPDIVGGFLCGSITPLLSYVELGKNCTNIKAGALSGTFLDAIVLRRESSIVASDAAFGDNGFSHAYVPRALISAYQSATNWSAVYASRNDFFLAIEDYTTDGTTEGEINRSLMWSSHTPAYEATDLTFNGTSLSYDTGVKLFDTDNTFTILVDFTPSNQNVGNPGNRHLLHCRDESTEVGFRLQNNANSVDSMSFRYKPTDGSYHNNLLNGTGSHSKVAVRSIGGRLTLFHYMSSGRYRDYFNQKPSGTLQNISNNLIIGAQDNNGTKSLFWNGVVHKIKVYKDAISSAEIYQELEI